MSFTIKIKDGELRSFTENFGTINPEILKRAIKKETWRLYKAAKTYAKNESKTGWAPYAPITKALRKGRGIGSWANRFLRFHIDEETLTSQIGVLGKADVKDPRFKPISNQFVGSYRALAQGYTFRQTRKRQRAQFAALRSKGKFGYLEGTDPFSLVGGKKKFKRLTVLVPKVGEHRVRARPIIDPVAEREREQSVSNIIRYYKDRVVGIKG